MKKINSATLDLSQVLSLSDKPAILKQLYLNTVRVQIGDQETFEYVKPKIEKVYTALLEDGRYMDEIASRPSVKKDIGFTVDVDMNTHLKGRRGLVDDQKKQKHKEATVNSKRKILNDPEKKQIH